MKTANKPGPRAPLAQDVLEAAPPQVKEPAARVAELRPAHPLEDISQPRVAANSRAVPVLGRCDVLHVSSVHPCDDVRIVYRECLVLLRAGFDVRAAFFDVHAADIDGVPLIDMGRRPRSRLLRAAIATWRMRALVREIGPRAVHIHDPELLPLALMLKRDGLVVFYDAHEDLPKQIFHKHWIPRVLRVPVSRLAARLLPRAFARVDGLVVAARHVHDASALDHHRVVLRNMPLGRRVRDGAVAPDFAARERAVAYVGAITPARNSLFFVRAALRTGCAVYLAGRGEASYVKQLVALDPDRVHYLGIIAPPDVAQVLDRCRVGVAVLPPTPAYLEAIPSKVFDYIKAELPCVISDFRSWHDDLGPEMKQYAVRPSDGAALARMLFLLLDDEAAWIRARVDVRKVAARYPTHEAEAARLLDMYRQSFEES